MRTDFSARFVVRSAVAMALAALVGPVDVAAAADRAPTSEDAPAPTQKIAVDLRGPLAVVTVTRLLSAERPRAATEETLDLALPDRAALLSVELDDHGRWRAVGPGGRAGGDAPGSAGARGGYLDALRARGIAPKGDPFDDDTTYRIRVARGIGGRGAASPPTAPVTVRYRFSALVEDAHGRLRLRFPPAPEATPPPADVTVVGAGLADLEIAGVRTALPARAAGGAGPAGSAATLTSGTITASVSAPASGSAAKGTATGTAAGAPPAAAQSRVSTRSGWEISYTLAPSAVATAGAKDGPTLEGAAAVAAISARESAIAFSVRAVSPHANGAGPPAPPANVLFVIDRSRSVGLPGLAAEHDVATRLLDLLAPTTRFDALFFDRTLTRLFPMARAATREAIGSIESEMVPDHLANGTDLEGALRAAGELLRREASSFGPRALLAVISDGALAETTTGDRLDRALGVVAGLELSVAAIVVRPGDDDAITPAARQALTALAEARGGVERELHADEINEGVPALIEAVASGGDVFSPRVALDKISARLPGTVAPGAGLTGVVRVPGKLRRAGEIVGVTRGRSIRAPLKPIAVDPAWLRPHAEPSATADAYLLSTPLLAALVEPAVHSAPPAPPATVRGTMDRDVVRNTLSLAFMPRARACYQSRSSSTAAMRDLTGRVRMAIDLVRGEVMDARVESSTLGQPSIETCLRDGAFALEVPRAYHNDESVTAIVNLVFRPRTPEKHRTAEDSFPIGAEIDLVLEELKNAEASPGPR